MLPAATTNPTAAPLNTPAEAAQLAALCVYTWLEGECSTAAAERAIAALGFRCTLDDDAYNAAASSGLLLVTQLPQGTLTTLDVAKIASAPPAMVS